MQALRIESADDARVDPYRAVRDPEWLKQRGRFVVESCASIELLLAREDLEVESVLLTETAWTRLQPLLAPRTAISVLVTTPDLMRTIGGYRFHQGALALVHRPRDAEPTALIEAPGSGRLVVLENVANSDNVGAIFRNALAFRARGVLLSTGCAHPFYRKGIRASTGAALRLPFALAPDWAGTLEALRAAGWVCAALSPDPSAEAIDARAAELAALPRLALLLGHEYDGLTPQAQAACDLRLRIRIAPDVDSLNVAAASAIALHRLTDV